MNLQKAIAAIGGIKDMNDQARVLEVIRGLLRMEPGEGVAGADIEDWQEEGWSMAEVNRTLSWMQKNGIVNGKSRVMGKKVPMVYEIADREAGREILKAFRKQDPSYLRSFAEEIKERKTREKKG